MRDAMHPKQLTEADRRRAQVAALARQRLDQAQIAAQLGVSQSTISRDLQTLRFQARYRWRFGRGRMIIGRRDRGTLEFAMWRWILLGRYLTIHPQVDRRATLALLCISGLHMAR